MSPTGAMPTAASTVAGPGAPRGRRGQTRAGEDSGRGRGARRLTRRRVGIAALVLVACAGAAIVLLAGPGRKAGTSTLGVPVGDTTTTVTRRTLTESSSVDGTLGYGAAMELYDRLAGTFTWLPSVGATIGRGGTLFRVNDLPVVLMYGSVPAYRTLKEGVSDGPDVEQLNRNLIALGFDPNGAISDDAHYGEATATAVRLWEHAEGLSETGAVELGRVVFAPSARRVTAVHVSLGQDPPGGDDPEAPAGGDTASSDASGHPAHDRSHPHASHAAEPPAKAKDHKPARTPNSSADSPANSKDPEPNSPAKEHDGESSDPGGVATAGTAVLTTTSTRQLVHVKVKAEQQQLARVGELAPVMLPGGTVVQGRVVEVGTVASEPTGDENEQGGGGGSPTSEGSGESATIPVTLALAHRVRRLDEAPVSVELVERITRNVLAVPATALFATGGDTYAIEVLEGNRRAALAVTPGAFADGYVQVEGAALREGQRVIQAE